MKTLLYNVNFTSHPFFSMTLVPLRFLVFQVHDLLYTQVYVYVYMYAPVKLCVKLHICVFFLRKETLVCVYP